MYQEFLSSSLPPSIAKKINESNKIKRLPSPGQLGLNNIRKVVPTRPFETYPKETYTEPAPIRQANITVTEVNEPVPEKLAGLPIQKRKMLGDLPKKKISIDPPPARPRKDLTPARALHPVQQSLTVADDLVAVNWEANLKTTLENLSAVSCDTLTPAQKTEWRNMLNNLRTAAELTGQLEKYNTLVGQYLQCDLSPSNTTPAIQPQAQNEIVKFYEKNEKIILPSGAGLVAGGLTFAITKKPVVSLAVATVGAIGTYYLQQKNGFTLIKK